MGEMAARIARRFLAVDEAEADFVLRRLLEVFDTGVAEHPPVSFDGLFEASPFRSDASILVVEESIEVLGGLHINLRRIRVPSQVAVAPVEVALRLSDHPVGELAELALEFLTVLGRVVVRQLVESVHDFAVVSHRDLLDNPILPRGMVAEAGFEPASNGL